MHTASTNSTAPLATRVGHAAQGMAAALLAALVIGLLLNNLTSALA